MEQLIFIGIILLFSILEAVARKKREGAEGTAPAPPGGAPEVRPPRVPEPHPPSYDQDPSFDDAAVEGSRGGPGRGTMSREGSGGQGGRTSSEGLIPADVWEEIQAMARGGKAPVRAASPPKPAPPPTEAAARVPVPTPARVPRAVPPPMSTAARKTRPTTVPEVDAVVVAEHAVHLTHPKYGKPVHDRLTGFGDDPHARGLSADSKALRSVLRGGGAGLRQAVLLLEILGPPVSLRDDPSAGLTRGTKAP